MPLDLRYEAGVEFKHFLTNELCFLLICVHYTRSCALKPDQHFTQSKNVVTATYEDV